MPSNLVGFKQVSPGLKWDRRRGLALFDVVRGAGKGRVRVRRLLPFDSLEAAKEAFPKFRADVKAGRYDQQHASNADELSSAVVATKDAPTMLGEYVESHWDSLHAKCGDSTKQTNRGSYERHLKPFFASMEIASIGEAHCEDFAAHMKARKLAPPTVNLALRLLRTILHHARRRGLRGAVPENFHFAKEALLQLEMTDEEQSRFFSAFDDRKGFAEYLEATQARQGKVVRSPHFGFKERHFGGGLRPDSDAAMVYWQRFRQSRLIFIAAVDLGYRVSDLRLLRRNSVDLQRAIVSIQTAKTGKMAVVPLSDRCRDAIRNALSQRVASTEYVFTTEDGLPYSESTLRRYFAVAKELAGIKRRLRINDLRHTFASNLVSEGVPLPVIRDALGHTTVRMSERYAKPNAHAVELMRKALNETQARVSGATQSASDAQETGQ